ncbi:MAG: response regulator [Verrucomicrobiota bacterium]
MQSENTTSPLETNLPELRVGSGVGEHYGQPEMAQATDPEHLEMEGKAAAVPLNVLIVEDRASDAQLMLHELQNAGFDPQWKRVETEAEYLAQLSPRFDLILSDFHLPAFNAWEALRLLNDHRLDVPFIVVTGSVGEEVAMKLVRAGAADYLLKDRLARLGEAVRQAITLRHFRHQKTAAEEAIAQAKALAEYRLADMEALMEAVPAIVFISHDRECRRMTGNRLGREVLRLPPDANLSKTAPPGEVPMSFQAMRNGTVIPPEELPLQQAAQSREIRDYEMDLVFADGSAVTIIGNATTLRDENGEPRGAVGAFVDITERKLAEDAMRQSEERLHLATSAGKIGVWDWNVVKNELTWDESMYFLYGIRKEDFGGAYEAWNRTLHPEDRQVAVEDTKAALRGEREYAPEFRIVRPGGAVRFIQATARIIRDQSGKALRMVGTNIDITERKLGEEKLKAATLSLERAKEAAEEASRAKDRFLAVLSHELRTPLTPILALTSVLAEDESLSDAVRGDLQMIERNVELEARLIDDLLDVTRITHGKIHLDKRPVDLCEIIRRVVEVCREDLKVRRIHFGVKTEGEPYPILADATRLQQVFWNLLKNALKFTPEKGCIGIECRRVGQSVVAEVIDSGKGIAAEDLVRIFNPFEQIERSESGAHGGLGLGLGISKGLVEMHGGTIEAKSEGLGLGATFCVTLPLAEETGPSTATPAAALNHGTKRALRILLVEDHGDTARILERLLRREGHDVRTAGDLGKALEKSRQWEFDLLLSDLGLPDGSGLDLMRQLHTTRPDVPGIAVSGYGTEEDVRLSQNAGFAEHLVKPLDMDRLRAAIDRVANAGHLPPSG